MYTYTLHMNNLHVQSIFIQNLNDIHTQSIFIQKNLYKLKNH